MSSVSESLQQAIVSLFNSERFYAEIILQMDRIISNRVPTMGVCIKEKVQLYVNPEFFMGLTLKERVALLKHECGHILHDHIPRFKTIAPDIYDGKDNKVEDAIINDMKHRSMNVAADCALNCNIPNLPKDAVTPDHFKLKNGETFEWYFENLKKNEQVKHYNEIDDHNIWGDSEGSKEIVKEKLRQAVEKAAQQTRGAGRMTSDDELLVSRLNHKSKDWRSVLRQFAARTLVMNLESSRKKRNRRYGITIPGNVKVEQLRIGVAIDTSGSVSDQALCQFMAEIANIAKYATVEVVEADSEVKVSYIFDPKKQYKVHGRGGTAYNPALEYFSKETEIDGLIYFGDMDCFDTEQIKKPKYPVLWAIVGSQEPPVAWGSRVKIEVKNGSNGY